MQKEIEIHPGHWANTGSGANGIIKESVENRRVAKRVYDILKASKVPVTYYEDNVSSNKRDNVNYLVSQHNKDKDGLIVSVHFNSSGATTSKPVGTEVLYSTEKELATNLSKSISLATGGGLIDRGAKKRTDIGVLVNTKEPAVLIEVCFVNSSVDVAIYNRDFEKICQAIASDLAKAIGKSTVKEEEDLKFSSAALKKKVNLILESKEVQKQLIKDGIAIGAFSSSWADKQKAGTITDGDWIGLQIMYLEEKGL